MSDRAAHTLTFVFTDIEGSTRLLRELGDDYQLALREHDEILVSAAVAEGGEVLGSGGDAQHFVFTDAAAAVQAAVTSQRRLAEHDWPEGHPFRVRMGIHSGAARRDSGGYTGMVLHVTARIADAGHGGQVLLSPTTAGLVASDLPAGVRLSDLGPHRFKDVEEPIVISQLLIEGLTGRFPPLRTAATSVARLPQQLTSFIERGELAALDEMSTRSRLLTLTGPGGTGKTRLAIALADRISHRFRDGTWFVALDAAAEPEVVPAEIVTTLGLSAGSEDPLLRLVDYLRERTILLVLDNLEQVVTAGEAIARILRECPGISVIATSRIPLRVYGEQEYPVPALALPPPGAPITATEAREYGSVRLFEERARAAKPAFELRDADAVTVCDIVTRLDGLPLAIELAAARLRMLPLAALRDRLDDSLATLSSGAVDRPDRQRTLRGAIAWSHDLLDASDRRLFARLGVFAGSAGLSEIEAVAGPAEEIGRDLYDGLGSLVEQSLVQVAEDASEARFTMLATIREFARERLRVGGEHDAIERRHAEAYLALAERAAPEIIGANAASWADRLERDHDDLRTALDRIVERDEAELGLRMIIALWRFWQVRGHLFEATDRIVTVLAMPSVPTQPAGLRSQAEAAAGGVAYWRSKVEACARHYETSLTLAREAGDQALIAEALYNGAFVPYAARQRPLGEQELGFVSSRLTGALELFRELGDEAGIAKTSWSLAIHAAASDDVDTARTLARESLEAARAIGDRYQIGWSLHTLGEAEAAAGDLDDAARHILESLDIWVSAGDISGITLLMLDAAVVARARGSEACSWRLLGVEERLREETGTDLGQYAIEFKGIVPRRQPEDDQERAWIAEGRALTTEEAITLARSEALC